jgi:hypothetical protein
MGRLRPDQSQQGFPKFLQWSENLNRFHSQPIARLDFGIRIVPHHEHFVRPQAMRAEDFLEETVFAPPIRFVQRVNVNGRKPVGETEHAIKGKHLIH